MRTLQKLSISLISILVINIPIYAQVFEIDFDKLKIGNQYKVLIKNGRETEGGLIKKDSISIDIKTEYKIFTIPKSEIKDIVDASSEFRVIYEPDKEVISDKLEVALEGGVGTRVRRFDPPRPNGENVFAVGYTVGIAGQYNFNNDLSLKLGATLDAKEYLVNGGSIDFIFPLLLKVKTGEQTKFFVNAGPYLGIVESKKMTGGITSNLEISNDSLTKKTDFGVSVGIGLEIPGKSGSLTIELRDYFGLTNINKRSEPAPEIKLSTLNLMIGYSFKFVKTSVKKK